MPSLRQGGDVMYQGNQCPVTMSVTQWEQHEHLCHTCFTVAGIWERRDEEDAAVREAVKIVSGGA